MRRITLVSGLIASWFLIFAPVCMLDIGPVMAAEIDQASDVQTDTGSAAVAFFTDVKRTIFEIPEPATLLLLGTGLAAASRVIQRRRRSL